MSTLALKGPYWVTVRRHRWALWGALALALAAAALLVTSRLWSDNTTAALRAAGCAVGSVEPSCFLPARDHIDGQWFARHLIEYTAWGMTVLPVLLGVFVAGPVIARELESGTYKLAWTQAVSPARWLTAKLAVPTALAVTAAPLLSLLFHWSWSTGPADDYPTFWYAPRIFASQGLLPVAGALLGIALGTVVGLLVRRTVPAMCLTALVTGAVLLTLARLRPGLWPVETLTGRELSVRVSTSWVLDNGMISSSGERIGREYCLSGPRSARDCTTGRGGVTDYADFHPSSHFWPLQLVESAVLLALAALALLAAFRVLRARHP